MNKVEFKLLKKFLRAEEDTVGKCDNVPSYITHNKDVVFIQFNGWSINLYSDGSYRIEDTTGG